LNWEEKNIENFIRQHKDEFDKYCDDNHHEEKFLAKLARRFKKIINIVPYLIRVLVITFIVFISSILIWNNYIRKDRHEVTLKQKIENIITVKK
jgi:hypothetical protein